MDPDSGSRLWLLTPKINQSCCDGSGTCSGLVCLSLRPVCLPCGLSVRGLGLVVKLLQLIVQKMSPTLQLVFIVFTFCRKVYRLVGGFLTDYGFSCPFFYDSTTFTTDLRVVGSVAGSAQVEHPH